MSAKPSQKGRRVFVVGVGMTNFCKPSNEIGVGPQYPDFAKIAVTRALEDAGLKPSDIEHAAVGTMFQNGGGQRALYPTGILGIPIHNVHNACATGSNALYLARQMVAGGMNECALALGFEKMRPGSLGGDAGGKGPREPTGLDVHYYIMNTKFPMQKAPPMAQFFGNAAREYLALYPEAKPEHFAMVGAKSHAHSVNNPYSQFRDPATLEQVQASPMIYHPLTKLQCSPTSDGAACAIVCSEDFVKKHNLQGQAIEILGQSLRTDEPVSISTKNIKENPRTMIDLIGFPMAKRCAEDVYAQAGKGPEDVQVVELHDCFSANEILTYEALGLAKPGEGWKLIASGNATFGGKYVINPSGGLISKGHPLGATGLAQCAELCWQLRGECGPRQVKDAKVALQHNLGLGGAVVCTMYGVPADLRKAGVAPVRKVSGAMGFPGSKL